MKNDNLPDAMTQWTPEQLLAVHDCCQLIGEMIWQNHQSRLLEYLADESIACGSESMANENVQLPFDDALPF